MGAVVALSFAFFKPDYLKNKLNIFLYIFLGIIICFGVAYLVGHDTSPPCLEREDNRCIEYDDSYIPPNDLEQTKNTAELFSLMAVPFLSFVYLVNRFFENKT